MNGFNELKIRFNKQMKKQRYDNSGRKQEFIEISDKLFKIVEQQQAEIDRLRIVEQAYEGMKKAL